jgi:hypothetical protein
MKGKNFSCNNVTGKRKVSDNYSTPYSITRQLLDRVHIHEPILEPACGEGAIVDVLRDHGYTSIEASDISTGADFLRTTYTSCKTIITNPPYSLAFEFIQKAKELVPEFYFLLPLSYLHGKKRYDAIWTDTEYPLAEIFVFTRYPMLGDPLRSDGHYRTGMMVYAWYHFVKGHCDQPTIRWLDNNEYVLSKKDLADD